MSDETKKQKKGKSDVGIWLAGIGCFSLITCGVLGVSHFAVQNAANNSRYEIEQTASEAVDRYADAVMADKLAQADAAAQRAEAAAKSAEDILSDVKSITEQSGDTKEAPEDVALSISDLVMMDTDIIDSARVEVTEDGYVVYIIAKGDTLCKISAGFGVSVDELVAYNHLVNKNLIYTGSSLRIPTIAELAEEDIASVIE